MKILSKNKKAYYDYEILDKFEAGISLFGWEVKSIRNGNVNLKDSFVAIYDEKVFVHGMHVSKWVTQPANEKINHTRERVLLLHKEQIKRLSQKIKTKGLTIVPLQIYLSNNQKIKVEIALVKGKREYDKKQRTIERELDRSLRREKQDGTW